MSETRIRELIFESAHPETLSTHSCACRITSLDHEVSDHAVKYDTIIVSLFCESEEILYCLGCRCWEELESDVSEVGGEEDTRIRHMDNYK